MDFFSEAGMELGMECGGMDLSRGVGMGVGHGAWRQGVYGVGPGAWRHGVVEIDQSKDLHDLAHPVRSFKVRKRTPDRIRYVPVRWSSAEAPKSPV